MKLTEEQYQQVMRRQAKPSVVHAAPAKRSKYGNKKTIANGMVFDSGHEARRYTELELMQAAGQIRNLRRQVPYDMVVNGQHICTYIADAVYERPVLCETTLKHWAETVEDSKSKITRKKPDYRLKVKLLAACHGIQIQEIL